MQTLELPYRLEPFGLTGWTSRRMSPQEAAAFVQQHPQAAMPCWKRFDVVAGSLVLVR